MLSYSKYIQFILGTCLILSVVYVVLFFHKTKIISYLITRLMKCKVMDRCSPSINQSLFRAGMYSKMLL